MSIEGLPTLNLDTLLEPKALNVELSQLEEKHQSLVSLAASIDSLERVVTSLMTLRATNISAILYLKKPEETLDDADLQALFKFLKDWDQLFLHNFLELCGDWVPVEFQSAIQNEAKIELKWAKEWLTANTDPRIYKYPSLPWRSFVRKIIGENYTFAVKFLEMTALPGTPENIQAIHQHLKAFLEAKKKVVCVFPKKWSGKLEQQHPTH